MFNKANIWELYEKYLIGILSNGLSFLADILYILSG